MKNTIYGVVLVVVLTVNLCQSCFSEVGRSTSASICFVEQNAVGGGLEIVARWSCNDFTLGRGLACCFIFSSEYLVCYKRGHSMEGFPRSR